LRQVKRGGLELLLICFITVMRTAQLLCLTFLGCAALNAQVITFSREQLIDYTKNNPFERSADGRPRVPDELLKQLEDVSAEEVWTILNRHHYNNQFEGHWRILHPDKRLVGRAVTAQFMPLREDVQSVAEEKANTGGVRRNANQRVIDSLQNGDVIVVDLYGKEEGGM
jgi:4-hydroxy-4-methyl-2-oxoglutarate aldolase